MSSNSNLKEAEAKFLAAKAKWSAECAQRQRVARTIIANSPEAFMLLSLASERYKAAAKEWYKEQQLYQNAKSGLSSPAMDAATLLEQIRLVVNTAITPTVQQAAELSLQQEQHAEFGSISSNPKLAQIAAAAAMPKEQREAMLAAQELKPAIAGTESSEFSDFDIPFEIPNEKCEHGVPVVDLCPICDKQDMAA